MNIAGVRMESSMTQVTSKNAPQRGQGATPGRREPASDAFEEKLRMLEEKEGKGAEEAAGERAAAEDEALIPLTAALDVPRGANAISATAAAAPTGPATPDDVAQAHIDRMAAAIAEAVSKPGQDVLTVDFGREMALVKSAIVARDASGMINITMVTPNAAMQPNAWAAMRNQLADRLDKRKLGVKSIRLAEEKDGRVPVQRHS
jgi:hypothetical protein